MSQWGEARKISGVTFQPVLGGPAFEREGPECVIVCLIPIDLDDGADLETCAKNTDWRFRGRFYADWLALPAESMMDP